MLDSISMGCDMNINILVAIQMFSIEWGTLSVATTANCFHKASIML